ncbi:MAG TPA: hypothetical protein VHX62_04495 [Solirubrobacteraceae bacterium]|jgi:hypothetical protein|nr:hypothetical protein [Solirubrobacteraceae bacterium]
MDLPTARITGSSAIPDSPPPGVLRAIAGAGTAYDRLEASGRRLHFQLAPDTGELTVVVLDLEGTPVGTVPARRVLDLAAGAPLD